VKKIVSFAAPKPKKDGSGSTIQFSLSQDSTCVFLTLAHQKKDTSIKDAKFDYDNKLVFKISAVELGSFIRVFSGKDESINGDKGLFHSFEDSKSVIKCNKNDPKYGGFYIKAMRGDDNCAAKLTDSEAEVLIPLFETAIVRIYNW